MLSITTFILVSITLAMMSLLFIKFLLFYREIASILNSVMSSISDMHELTSEHMSNDLKNELTDYEMERIERENLFDERINSLRNDVMEANEKLRRGALAEEFHPAVKNLPHDSIQYKEDEDTEEWAR